MRDMICYAQLWAIQGTFGWEGLFPSRIFSAVRSMRANSIQELGKVMLESHQVAVLHRDSGRRGKEEPFPAKSSCLCLTLFFSPLHRNSSHDFFPFVLLVLEHCYSYPRLLGSHLALKPLCLYQAEERNHAEYISSSLHVGLLTPTPPTCFSCYALDGIKRVRWEAKLTFFETAGTVSET